MSAGAARRTGDGALPALSGACSCFLSQSVRATRLAELRHDEADGAWAPDVPGCVAVGDTIEECEREMRDAIQFHIDGLRQEGEQVPEPAAVAAAAAVVVVEVA